VDGTGPPAAVPRFVQDDTAVNDQHITNEYPDQQAHRRHAAINDRCRNRRSGDGFAVFAGVLGADVTMHGKYGGYDIELFSHIFTDFD